MWVLMPEGLGLLFVHRVAKTRDAGESSPTPWTKLLVNSPPVSRKPFILLSHSTILRRVGVMLTLMIGAWGVSVITRRVMILPGIMWNVEHQESNDLAWSMRNFTLVWLCVVAPVVIVVRLLLPANVEGELVRWDWHSRTLRWVLGAVSLS